MGAVFPCLVYWYWQPADTFAKRWDELLDSLITSYRLFHLVQHFGCFETTQVYVQYRTKNLQVGIIRKKPSQTAFLVQLVPAQFFGGLGHWQRLYLHFDTNRILLYLFTQYCCSLRLLHLAQTVHLARYKTVLDVRIWSVLIRQTIYKLALHRFTGSLLLKSGNASGNTINRPRIWNAQSYPRSGLWHHLLSTF